MSFKHIDSDGYGAPLVKELRGLTYAVGIEIPEAKYGYEIQRRFNEVHTVLAMQSDFPSVADADIAAREWVYKNTPQPAVPDFPLSI
ncbi:MAG TPA: hypothetical protein VL357_05995 [Rariglobus sp.]|jgi:hypothetical protein|nr:hypothetical protein [Rariglobus sp.]